MERISPNAASWFRLIRALSVETHEDWLEDKRYLNMDLLWEARKRSPVAEFPGSVAFIVRLGCRSG